jgi:hypothetical protein
VHLLCAYITGQLHSQREVPRHPQQIPDVPYEVAIESLYISNACHLFVKRGMLLQLNQHSLDSLGLLGYEPGILHMLRDVVRYFEQTFRINMNDILCPVATFCPVATVCPVAMCCAQ